MLLKQQLLGRDAVGSNGHVQMANDYQIVRLKPGGSAPGDFVVVGTHLTQRFLLSVLIPGVLGCCIHPPPSSGTSASSLDIRVRSLADVEAMSPALLRMPEYMRASCAHSPPGVHLPAVVN